MLHFNRVSNFCLGKKKEKKKNKNLGTPRSKQAERSIFIYKMLNNASEKNGMISL